jgi:hypothetical protein
MEDTLKTMIRDQRAAGESDDQAAVKDVEPFEEEVDGGEILDKIVASLRRFLVLPAHADIAIALWILASWAMDAFEIFPLLTATSPVKRCGKTTFLSILGRLLNLHYS